MSDELTLEKLKILDRVQSVETVLAKLANSIDTLASNFEKHRADIKEIINKHDLLLLGNGEPEKGLVMKVSNLVDDKKSRDSHMKGVWTSLVGIIITILGRGVWLFIKFIGGQKQ